MTYITSNHAHEVLGSALGDCDATTNIIRATPVMQPVKTPVMKREGARIADRSKPQRDGKKYCVFNIAVRMKAWRANATSLKVTVGV